MLNVSAIGYKLCRYFMCDLKAFVTCPCGLKALHAMHQSLLRPCSQNVGPIYTVTYQLKRNTLHTVYDS